MFFSNAIWEDRYPELIPSIFFFIVSPQTNTERETGTWFDFSYFKYPISPFIIFSSFRVYIVYIYISFSIYRTSRERAWAVYLCCGGRIEWEEWKELVVYSDSLDAKRYGLLVVVVVCGAVGGCGLRVRRRGDLRRQVSDHQWPTQDSFLWFYSLS